jgi:hypothetical protein
VQQGCEMIDCGNGLKRLPGLAGRVTYQRKEGVNVT